ncbi:MAG: rhomboid family intramembrane serine protease [Spirochaetales bacterium]|nr:rhomboid family intramembrane serine protease [Spirochaetales bacterium]
MSVKIKYNAPATLTIALIATILVLIDQVSGSHLIPTYFMVPGRGLFNTSDPLDWMTLFTHILGHSSWTHLLSNMALMLLLGPILEEKYGSVSLFFMIFITAIVTGLLNAFLFPTALLGASGVVFMMILLTSFTNNRNGEIPLTFILILILYLAVEIINAFSYDDISQFAHIIGGVFGSLFGFLRPRKR